MKKILFSLIIGLVVLFNGLISVPAQAALINFSKIDKEGPKGGKKLDARKMDENQIKVRRIDEDQLKMRR